MDEICCNFCGRKKIQGEEFLQGMIEPKAYICFQCLGGGLRAIGVALSNTAANVEKIKEENNNV